MQHSREKLRARLPELSNQFIDRYYKQQPHYAGCFPKDKLPTDIAGKFCIVNLQSSRAGDGTHWTLLYNVNPSSISYFDPMGEIPPESVERVMNKTGKRCEINNIDLQPINSSSCGWWCMYAADHLLKGWSLPTITSTFRGSLHNNETMLAAHFSKRHLILR
jgi:hypothetical protein